MDEILANASAHGSLLGAKAAAMLEQQRQRATVQGWSDMCERLGLSKEDHKLSALMIKALREHDDLYVATDYEKMVLHARSMADGA